MKATRGSGTEDVVVKCSGCGKMYKVHPDRLPEGVLTFPCRTCGSLVPIDEGDASNAAAEIQPEGAWTVLIAVNEDELAGLIRRILIGHGYRAITVSTGKETLQIAQQSPVDLLLINVFLPDMMGFEVLDQMRDKLGADVIRSILLSSIHHSTRYKRAPTSLYGADDYLERHHLPDLLVPKIERLLKGSKRDEAPISPRDMPPLTDEQVLQRRQIEEIENAATETGDPSKVEIRRMCRVIAGDIALYNEDVISSAEPHELLEAIEGDLREGETLLDRKFPGTAEHSSQILREEIVLLLQSRGIQIP